SMSSTGTCIIIRPASLTQSRRRGCSVSEIINSIPCARSQANSSGPPGRASAARSGLSIQVKPSGFDMSQRSGLWPKGSRRWVALLPQLRVGLQEVDQVAGTQSKKHGGIGDAGLDRRQYVEHDPGGRPETRILAADVEPAVGGPGGGQVGVAGQHLRRLFV